MLEETHSWLLPLKHRINADFYVSRDPDYYLYSIVLVTFLIGVFNLVIVGIPPDDLSGRVSITLTLMLTAVAFKFVTVNFVPATTYQTKMDWYTTTSFMFIGVAMAESFFVNRLFVSRF